jgi:hypothetical protein
MALPDYIYEIWAYVMWFVTRPVIQIAIPIVIVILAAKNLNPGVMGEMSQVLFPRVCACGGP